MRLFFIVATITNLLFGYINYNVFLNGYTPTAYQAYSSIIFAILWLGIGFYFEGKYRKITFWLSIFWLTGFVLILISYWFNLMLVFMFVTSFFCSPIYGVSYFIKVPPTVTFSLICMISTYGMALIGIVIRKSLMVLRS